MLTNTVVTLYNRYMDDGAEKYSRTVLRDVSWQAGRQHAFTQDGVSGGSVADVYIPFSVDAEGKRYLLPKQFTPEGWTLQKKDYLVKGVCPYEHGLASPVSELLSRYDDVVTITGVETCDFGSAALAHWEVSCR